MSYTPSPAPTSNSIISTLGVVYTFRWICPNPKCHSCPARTTRYKPSFKGLDAQYFDYYSDMQQLALEVDMEELQAKVLTHCDGQCKARQVFKSRNAKAIWATTGHQEWSYVGNAKCTECRRTAGRTACLVDIQREGEPEEDRSIEQESSVEQYIE